jgi:hypothetical protein
MKPCGICGYLKGGAPEGERYCRPCEQSISLTLTPKQQAERRAKKMKRTDEGTFSPWSLRYWVSG